MPYTKQSALTALSLLAGVGFHSHAAPVFSHPRAITNPYLPLGTLKQDVLVSREDGHTERVLRTVQPGTRAFVINGQTVHAMIVEDRESVNGHVSEVTQDYFAQSDDGAVYYLGESVNQYRNGRVSGHEGAWLVGKETHTPGLLMPAHPKVGDTFRSEDVPGVTVENDDVVSADATVSVNGMTYRHCVKTRETTADGVEYKYYAPGVGVVQEGEGPGAVKLLRHTTRAATGQGSVKGMKGSGERSHRGR